MICKHNIESENGCKACWKERAERAEAACAEMRRIMVIAAEGPGKDWLEHQAMLCDWLVHHEDTSCGQGWLSPDKAKLLVKALERIIEIRPYERCNDVGHVARQALAAVAKGEQK